ncbi:hypothetical protein CRUP_007020 [Coryphaenoides rupestris]|nr:hypothetical protein CRUP_007020 [Coryphaenoides rupestris]
MYHHHHHHQGIMTTGAPEHYGGGSYHSAYPAYMSPHLGGTWPGASPFDSSSSALHGLQGATRHPTLGKRKSTLM